MLTSRVSEARRTLLRTTVTLTAITSATCFASIPTLTLATSTAIQQPPPQLHQAILDAANELNILATDVLYADSGWALASAIRAIHEYKILRLCETDDTLIGLNEAILEDATRS